MKIPIENIYFLLCYAWNKMEESRIVSVKIDDRTSLLDLFAKVLVSGTKHLLKRGLDRDYLVHDEDIRGLRGKIDWNSTLKRQLTLNAMLHCHFDELSYDVLHNRILKTTLDNLIRNKWVDGSLRSEIKALSEKLAGIASINLQSSDFNRVQLNRNNYFYGFLLNICELIFHFYFISEQSGSARFRSMLQDRATMSKLFESFIRNFYRLELADYPGYNVIGAENIRWDCSDAATEAEGFLPIMRTDISIKTPVGYLVLDTKYYGKALQSYRKATVRSSHLYQIFAYVKNIAAKGKEHEYSTGVLLYPTVRQDLDLEYRIQGHRMRVRTLNLNKPWRDISDNLMALVGAVPPADGKYHFKKIVR